MTTTVSLQELIDEIGERKGAVKAEYVAIGALEIEVRRQMEGAEKTKVQADEYEAVLTPGKLTTRDDLMPALLEVEGLGQEVLEKIRAYVPVSFEITGLSEAEAFDLFGHLQKGNKALLHPVPAKWNRQHDSQIKSLGGKHAADILERSTVRDVPTLKITKKGK